jgi:hypothetical protein
MATPEPASIAVEAAGSEVRLRWSPEERGWQIDSRPDWSRLEGIRLVSAVFEDGATLGVAAVRPRGARGHGDDAVAATFVDADGLRIATSEALVSVEYDAAGLPRRLGVELWPDQDSPPIRVAADRDAANAGADAPMAMAFRVDGVAGSGTYQTIRQG